MKTDPRSAGVARRAMIAVVVGLSGMAAGRAGGAPTVIPTNDSVPLWAQKRDYRGQMDDLPTELKYSYTNPRREVTLKYKDLTSIDYNVRWPYDDKGKREPWLYAEKIGSTTGQVLANVEYYSEAGGEFDGIAGGAYHCMPTSLGMLHEWTRAEKLKKLTDFKGADKTIQAYALEGDTNDIAATGFTAARQSDGVVSMGTRRDDGLKAAAKIFRESHDDYKKDGGPTVKAFEWGEGAYKKAIDAGRPVVLDYKNKDDKLGHAVVGVGYEGASAVVKDPWTGEQKAKAFADMTGLGAAWADNLGGPPPSTGFDQAWDGLGMQLLAIPDYGDSPSTYEPSDSHQARHRDQFGQWLGDRVTGEVGLFDAGDDEDGVANVGDRDGGDDGVRFRWNADGTGVADITVTMRDWAREADPDIDGPDAYGHAAADPNLYLSVWADPMQTGSWDSAIALLSGEIVGQITENGTGAITQFLLSDLAMPASSNGEPYWVRVRLSREAGLGAFGATEYGEVEDYRVPTPGVLTLASLAVGLALARRRDGVAASGCSRR